MKSILITGLIASSVICNPAQAIASPLLSTKLNQYALVETKAVVDKDNSVQAINSKSNQFNKKEDKCIYPYTNELSKQVHEYNVKKEEEERKRLEKEQREKEQQQLELQRKASVKFDPLNVRIKSNIKADELVNVLKHTTGGKGLIPYASYFVEAEKTYGINALFLTGIAAQESGWGKKPAGDGTNLTGHGVYTATTKGTVFEGGNPIRQNILETAKLLAKDYTVPGAKCWKVSDRNPEKYNGTSIYSINLSYCFYQDQKTVDFRWSESIADIAKNLEKTYHSIEK